MPKKEWDADAEWRKRLREAIRRVAARRMLALLSRRACRSTPWIGS
jgi:hypothetical protein